MEKIVFIGQSTAFLPAINTIFASKKDVEITIISCDGHLPYDQTLLTKLISKQVKEKDIFPADESYYQKLNIKLVIGKSVSRINFTRKRIFLEDKQSIDFDCLVFSDTPQIRMPEYKGIRREGVFHLSRLETVKSLVRFLPFVETVVVECMDFPTLQTAVILKELGKDVNIVFASERILPQMYSDEQSLETLKRLEERGINVFLQQNVEAVLGETEVKAVRFTSGKIIASDMIVLSHIQPDFRFLGETDLVLNEERMLVDAFFRTNLLNVYAIDQVFQLTEPFLRGSYTLSKQMRHMLGVRVAQSICSLTAESLSLIQEDIPLIEDVAIKEGSFYE